MQEQIDRFVEAADRLSAEYWQKMGYIHSPAPTHQAETLSDKWVRVTVQNGTQRSVYAFICLKDYSTKTLGQLKAGDIHKAASWKIPAKHARGNIMDDKFVNCLTPQGVIYLK